MCKAYIMGCSGFTGSLKNFTVDAFFDVVELWCAASVDIALIICFSLT